MSTSSEADQLALFDTVGLGFDRAVTRADVVERDFGVAGFRLRLRFAGPALIPAIVPAVAHLELPVGATPDLTIDLFDSESPRTPLPFLAARLVDLMRLRWWETLQGRREIKGMNGARIRSVFHLGPDILVLWDRERKRGLYWVERADSIPYYEKGYPLSVLFNWWLSSLGHQVVHAACIGGPHGGVLLTGRGGSGKSTTTLTCILAGLQIAGDDYAAIDTADGTAHSLYNTIKLKTLADVDRFPGLAARVSNLERVGDGPHDEKAMVFLHEYLPQGLTASMPIRAILVPRIVDRAETTIVPAPAALAFKALAPSTVFQLPGNSHDAFRTLAQLTRRLPTYEIQLGSDFSKIPGIVDDFISGWQPRA